ncbi:MAG: hypothetical protein V7742_16495 [Halioglobus sp.]
MAAVAFDSLKRARRLKDAGYTDKQAEVQAEIMAEAFVSNIDSLVTKDYLDARLQTQSVEIKGDFRLIYWMLAIVIASTVIPTLTSYWS